MTIIPGRLLEIEHLHLRAGAHASFEEGACLLEAASWLADEPFSDHPSCVDPVLAAFGRSWNDGLDDEDRDRILKPFLHRLVGTASTAQVQCRRSFMAFDWLVRVCTPAWLCLARLDADADALAALPEITSVADARKVLPTVERAGTNALAARAAAWAAARDAAGDAARDAARAAGWSAAGPAAWAAAWATARAAGDAAWPAAWATAGATAGAAGDAAWAVAGSALSPTVGTLQESAADLFDRMIAAGEAHR